MTIFNSKLLVYQRLHIPSVSPVFYHNFPMISPSMGHHSGPRFWRLVAELVRVPSFTDSEEKRKVRAAVLAWSDAGKHGGCGTKNG